MRSWVRAVRPLSSTLATILRLWTSWTQLSAKLPLLKAAAGFAIMRITDIKPTKRLGRYSVYLDGKFSFALSDLELSASSLRIGDELSSQQVSKWQIEAVQSKLRAQTLSYLAIRPR